MTGKSGRTLRAINASANPSQQAAMELIDVNEKLDMVVSLLTWIAWEMHRKAQLP